MATTGLIQVASKRAQLSTTTTGTGDLFGNVQGPFNPYTFPFPGTVVEIIVNRLQNISPGGAGTIELLQYTGSVGAAIPLGSHTISAGTGLETFPVSYAFAANDGFQYEISAIAAFYQVILKVEYSLI